LNGLGRAGQMPPQALSTYIAYSLDPVRKEHYVANNKDESAARKQLVQGLQDDLAREYKAIIQYIIFSQKLDKAQYMNIADQLKIHAHQELDHALAIARQLDYLGVYPVHMPKPVEVSEDNEEMLWADLRAEDDTIGHYRERIRQAEAAGEVALAEILKGIITQEQDHQIDLATALGVIPDSRIRPEKGGKGKK
jgi:bacterioferritin